MIKDFLDALLDFLLPPRCHVCRTFIADRLSLPICPNCRDGLLLISAPLCSVCGVPFEGDGPDHLCGECIGKSPAFDAARAALVYSGAGRELIHRLKYRNKTHLRRSLALLAHEYLSDFVSTQSADLIVPVPLHAKRLRHRGFNQAVLLAEILAEQWGIPLERQLLRRVRETRPQIDLTAEERRANVRGAFAIHPAANVTGKHLLLLDDVFTTGSTVQECAKVLKKGGASKVVVITVARAVVA